MLSYFQCVLIITIHFVSKFFRKAFIFEEIRAFSIYKSLTMKKWSKIWWCHRRSFEMSDVWKFIFSMLLNKSLEISHKHQRKKLFLHHFISNWNRSGHILPSPKSNRVEKSIFFFFHIARGSHNTGILLLLHYIWHAHWVILLLLFLIAYWLHID